ncbi:hypothetical protein AVEN_244529-1 [Araneus ventricosus]|uniref:Tc1-like transposase DDE domain-containing protein n=1 Tax=Araneus ventricosus TaxID=182803 RepID=A0A4Y2F681_ARAVE|nr:hypothetical protein AVEN_244529-1 [Araneus ventricosus]
MHLFLVYFTTAGVVLIHDNARLYNAVVTQQLLEEYKWEVSDHPSSEPDLTTSDFHLFPELQNWLGGQSFQNNGPLRCFKSPHLTSLAATCSKEGI